MKKKPTQVLYVATLLDRAGTRHIIPGKDLPSLCGATGSQHFPHDHPTAELCQRCVEAHVRMVLERRLGEMGL